MLGRRQQSPEAAWPQWPTLWLRVDLQGPDHEATPSDSDSEARRQRPGEEGLMVRSRLGEHAATDERSTPLCRRHTGSVRDLDDQAGKVG